MELHNIEIDREPIFEQQKIQISNLVMLYYKPKEPVEMLSDGRDGFDFCVVESISYPIDHENIIWTSSDEHEVEIICEGYGYWDGVRHLDWYPVDDGYVNYPNLKTLKRVCDTLMELEKKYCTESEWFDYDYE